jgi:uracil-DNA glycosylase family 4
MAYNHSNSKYDRIKEIKKLKEGAYYAAITCESHGCPLFSRCSQFASMGKKTNRTQIKLFFVFDAPDQGDVNEGVAAVSDAGMYFRNNWLNPFIQYVGAVSYLITHLVRTPIVDAKNSPRAALASEAAYCWEHFWRDLMEYKPKALVVFGAQVFQQLYQKAINKEALPDAEAQNIIKLRKNSYKMQFTADYTVDVYVGYAPSYILGSPQSLPQFEEDMKHVVNYMSPGKLDISKQKIEIDKIDLIDTADGALDFIDFLTRGLPQNEMFDLAFDTETDDLNRVFNNKFLSWQFSYKPGHAVFIPIEHPEKPIFADIKLKLKLIAAFQNLLNGSPEQTRIAWILAHNAKFDLSVLYGLYRILPRGSIPIWDTLLAMHWLNENRKAAAGTTEGKPYALKTLGKEFFTLKDEHGNWVAFEYKSEALAARAEGDLVNLSFDALVEYGGTDTILTWHLKQEQMRQANLQKGNALTKLDRFMRHYYSPASRAIAFMECNGLHVSKDQLQYLQGEESPIWNRIDRIEKIDLQTAPEVLDFKDEYKNIILGTNIAYEDDLWGNDNVAESELVFNPNKKDQETPFYLDFLKLTPLALSKKTNKPTLNKEFLNHYASRDEYLTLPNVAPYVSYYTTPLSYDEEGDPVFPKNPLQLILELRELSKLGNTYLKGIGDMIGDKKGDCIDGRVRASYWMSGCDTGRLCLRFDSRISVVGDYAKSNLTPPISPVKHGIPIKDVKIGDLVFCYDDEGNLQIRKVLWQGKTGTKKLLRLHWSAGNGRKTGHLDLTPEHKVRLLDGTYKMAKDLKPDDRLLTMARCVVKTNSNKKNYYSKIYTQKTMINEHRFIYENVNGSKAQTVHHADGNSLNNHPSNLVATTTSKHTSEHLKEHWENGVFANRPTKGEGHYLWNHQGKFTFLKELAKVKGHRRSPEGLANKNLIKSSAAFKRRCQLFGIDTRVIRMRYDGHGVYISKGRLQRLLTTDKSAKVILDLKIDYRTLKALLSYYGQEHLIVERKREGREGKKHSYLRNHVVVKIEELDGFHDVYDLEVDDCHNFIANEICVHNSSSSPNLQNLPAGRSKMAKEIKNLFQAEPPSKKFPDGTVLLQLDYKTAEVRWAAIFANDQNLIRVFKEARESLIAACAPDSTMSDEEFEATQLESDIHRRTASLMFNVSPKDVSKSMRQASKCLVGSTKLLTNKGIVPISDLVPIKDNDANWCQPLNDVIVSSNKGAVAVRCINHKWVESTIKLDTATGVSIQGDEDHPLLVWHNCEVVERKLKDIEEGDLLIVSRSNTVWPTESPKIDFTMEEDSADHAEDCSVQCLICGENLGNLTNHLTVKHGVSSAEYRKQFPHSDMVSSAQIAKRMKSLLGTKYNLQVPNSPSKMSPALASVLGYLVAEGDGQKYTMSGNVHKSTEMLQDFLRCFSLCFGLSPKIREYPQITTTGVITVPQKVVRYLFKLGLIKGYSNTQRVPEIIFRSTKKEIIAFLRAYFEGESSVKSNSIVVMSASELLMQDIQYLLLSLNIVSKKFSDEVRTPVGKELRTYYGLMLGIRDSRIFREVVGFISQHKQEQADAIKSSSGQDSIYGLDQLLKELKRQYKVGDGGLHRYAIDGVSVRFGERISKSGKVEYTHEKLASRPHVLDALRLWSKKEHNLVYESVSWLHQTKSMLVAVSRKTIVEEKTKVYDIEVDDPEHIFVANGFLSKNCITFGLLFGMGTQTLAKNNGWTDDEAEEKIEMFYSAFPQLRDWLERNPKIAERDGYVETMMGRRRRLQDLYAVKTFKTHAKASRLAKNAPIQGQSSDGGNIGLINFFQFLLDNKLEKKWLIQNVVHDSCLVQVPMADLEKALEAMQYYFVEGMADYIKKYFNFTLPLPIECEIEVGLKYGDLTKWDGRPSTLPGLREKLKEDAKKLWSKKEDTGKPPSDFDLIPWCGK